MADVADLMDVGSLVEQLVIGAVEEEVEDLGCLVVLGWSSPRGRQGAGGGELATSRERGGGQAAGSVVAHLLKSPTIDCRHSAGRGGGGEGDLVARCARLEDLVRGNLALGEGLQLN